MKNRDRLYFAKKFIKYRDRLKKDDINYIGLGEINRLNLFIIAMAIGLETPKEIDGSKQDLVQLKDLKDSQERALFTLIRLGKAKTNEEIDETCKIENNFDDAEKCANSGFEVLFDEIEKCKDADLFKKKMLDNLEVLYKKNIKLS